MFYLMDVWIVHPFIELFWGNSSARALALGVRIHARFCVRDRTFPGSRRPVSPRIDDAATPRRNLRARTAFANPGRRGSEMLTKR
jgi:hypothetical protein